MTRTPARQVLEHLARIVDGPTPCELNIGRDQRGRRRVEVWWPSDPTRTLTGVGATIEDALLALPLGEVAA